MLDGAPSPEEDARGENNNNPEREGDNAEKSGSLSNTEFPSHAHQEIVPKRWETVASAYSSLVTGLQEGYIASIQLLHGVHSVGIKTSSGSFWKFDFDQEFFNDLQKALIYPFQKTGVLACYGALPYEDKNGDVYELLCTLERERKSKHWVIDTIESMAAPRPPVVVEASAHVRELFSQVQELLNKSPLKDRGYQMELVTVEEDEFIEISNIPNIDSLVEVVMYLQDRLRPIQLHASAEYDMPSRLMIRYHDPEVKGGSD
ncbi:MAG: hypothetical protein ACO3XO_09875 [Bdellovibrionota bacterium]